jgi:hypothetical protein
MQALARIGCAATQQAEVAPGAGSHDPFKCWSGFRPSCCSCKSEWWSGWLLAARGHRPSRPAGVNRDRLAGCSAGRPAVSRLADDGVGRGVNETCGVVTDDRGTETNGNIDRSKPGNAVWERVRCSVSVRSCDYPSDVSATRRLFRMRAWRIQRCSSPTASRRTEDDAVDLIALANRAGEPGQIEAVISGVRPWSRS